MPQKVYVGNLPYRTTEDDLRRLFKKYEPIHSLILIADKETEQPCGYGFIELDEPMVGDALYDLSDTTYNGRSLKIGVATGRNPKSKAPKKERAPVRNAPEKRLGSKPTAVRAATPRRNRQMTITEYTVADVNNYG